MYTDAARYHERGGATRSVGCGNRLQRGTKRFSSRWFMLFRRGTGELMPDANTGWLVRGERAGKLWTTAVNRNQAESIITVGSLPRDSTNRQGGI